MVVDVGE